ncbi:50S ribosomal protein L25/general stress protein Ctc [Gaetbulibacter aquiaggeris]|uniref:Large ribosomal subunit protein bL25 n=1 Tax=Gaetbulibacter aquiaggeris TaxID=1735373 RepID=A0ABW7MRM2_9FLAO
MKSITLNGSQRESVGKKATKALRNAGQVPCVLYGGDKPVHFYVEELAFTKLVYTPNAHTAVIALDNGKTYNAVMQDIQFHPVTDKILHVDFYQLFEDKLVTMDIPVHITGSSPGVRNGGRLLFRKRKLAIRALPSKLPDVFNVDISKLKIGMLISVEELKSEDFTILHPDSQVVVQVKTARTAIAVAEDEEEGAEVLEGAEATAEGTTSEEVTQE